MFDPRINEAGNAGRVGTAGKYSALHFVQRTEASMEQFGRLYGASDVMQSVYEQIARVAPSDASVLIVGENGSGKELAAQTIHEMSACADQPFLAVNCGALPPDTGGG